MHYSTDFVFDGVDRSTPYTEADAARPQSVYGTSKLVGEWQAAIAPRAYVLRVESLFGGVYVRSSVDKLIAGLERGEPLRVFADRSLTPSYVADVVQATRHLVETEAPAGLYHCVNSGVTNWLELTEELARLTGRSETARLEPVAFASVTLKAKRPQYCALSNAKLRAAGFDDAGVARCPPALPGQLVAALRRGRGPPEVPAASPRWARGATQGGCLGAAAAAQRQAGDAHASGRSPLGGARLRAHGVEAIVSTSPPTAHLVAAAAARRLRVRGSPTTAIRGRSDRRGGGPGRWPASRPASSGTRWRGRRTS